MESFNNFKRRKPQKFSISPRLKKLKEDFIKNGGKFEKYEIGNLFDIHPTKSYGLTNNDLYEINGIFPVISNTSINNGVGGYTNLKPTEKGNMVTYSDTTTSDGIFYQPSDFVGYSHVQGLYPYSKNKWNEKSLLYFVSLFKKGAANRFDYANKFNRKIAKKINIELPIKNNEISFKYMENYISELEEERISELTAYLKISGLEDYKLTKDEQESIDKINKNTIKFQEFKIENVLNWQSQKEIDPLKIELLTIKNPIKYPFYGQATINNGIISYESLQDTVLNNKMENPTILIHSNNQNCVYLETPFYLKDGHGATSVLQNSELNKLNAQYIITCISKIITKKFNYNNKATKIALKNTKISLPVNKDNQIDYIFMETYIKAIEKLVIKNVVEWRDKQINATKQVVNNV